jgi:hypothetical protein
MASFDTALRTRLLAAAPVSAITTSIHWGIVPQNKPVPYIRLNTISDPLDEHLKGYTDRQRPRVQADCFASTYLVARDLARKVIAAVESPATVSGVAFNRIKAEGPRDGGENVEGIGFVFMASVDLLVEHKLV